MYIRICMKLIIIQVSKIIIVMGNIRLLGVFKQHTCARGNQKSNATIDHADINESLERRVKRKLLNDAPECVPYYEAIVRSVESSDIFWMPQSITKLNKFLYLGSQEDADDLMLLEQHGITHIINTVDGTDLTSQSEEKKDLMAHRRKIYMDTFKYLGFDSDDSESYPIMHHFPEVFDFIESARQENGKCLIHCMRGVNRSGALATAYIMVHNNIGPITAARKVRKERRVLLTNYSFISRLLLYAKENRYLEKDEHLILACGTGKSDMSQKVEAKLHNDPQCLECYNKILEIVNNDEWNPKTYPKTMSTLTEYLCLGSIQDARDLLLLKKNGITHIIDTVNPMSNDNMKNSTKMTQIKPKILSETNIEYMGFLSQDADDYPIMNHFDVVFQYIESVRGKGGKCLIHCIEGINRSGVLATAYLMVKEQMTPVGAVRYVLARRGMILSNTSFIVALILLAKEKKLLKTD